MTPGVIASGFLLLRVKMNIQKGELYHCRSRSASGCAGVLRRHVCVSYVTLTRPLFGCRVEHYSEVGGDWTPHLCRCESVVKLILALAAWSFSCLLPKNKVQVPAKKGEPVGVLPGTVLSSSAPWVRFQTHGAEAHLPTS